MRRTKHRPLPSSVNRTRALQEKDISCQQFSDWSTCLDGFFIGGKSLVERCRHRRCREFTFRGERGMTNWAEYDEEDLSFRLIMSAEFGRVRMG